MCRSWLTPVGARTGSKRIKASSCRRVWHPCHTHAPQHNLLWLARWCSSCAVPSRGCSSLCCTNKVNDAFLRGWCTFRGCAVSAAPTSKWCISARLVHFWSVGALLVCWCTSGLLVHFWSVGALETSAPPKKNPNRGEPPLGFSFICVFRYLLNKHLLRCAVAHLNNVDALLRSRELLAVERVVLLLISLA